MSCACGSGCGSCSKCGCHATCTCNQNIWSLESGAGDFSYMGMTTVADELDGQYNFSGDKEFSSQSERSSVAGETCSKKVGAQRQKQQDGSLWQWDLRQ